MDPQLSEIRIMTLAQLSHGQDWRIKLAHSREDHILIWTTRGQGRVLVDGRRRGLGPHNALWIPAGEMFSLDLGAQSIGQAVIIPMGAPFRLPEMPRHLRIRDGGVQSELTGLIETAQRELHLARPLYHDALEAHAGLMSVWIRRQIMEDEHVPDRRNAAARISAAFCSMVAKQFPSGVPMADYAASLGVTPTHLTRAVKNATGKTAAELLTERVLHAARCLLEETSEPAQEIARHLGFGSAAYFSRFMQQHAGAPPSKLRGKRQVGGNRG